MNSITFTDPVSAPPPSGAFDRFFLKLFHDEEELRLHLLVDASRSMAFGEPQKIDHARRVAAALAYVALSSMNRVKIVALTDEAPTELTWQRGVQSIGRIFGFLEGLEPGGKNALLPGIRRWVSETRPSGVVVLISDAGLRTERSAATRSSRSVSLPTKSRLEGLTSQRRAHCSAMAEVAPTMMIRCKSMAGF